MRFLCSTFGSSGDVFPMLGLALELKRRGHRVAFATNGHYAALAGRHGVEFEALGGEDEFRAAIEHPDLWDPRRSFRHIYGCFRPQLRRQYDWFAAAQAEGPIVGITNCFGLGALLAQEKLGFPLVTLHLQPAAIWSRIAPPTLPGLVGPRWLRSLIYDLAERLVLDPVVMPDLDAWRLELDLPRIRRISRYWHSPRGVLCLFPEWFAKPQADWPQPLMQTDFPLWNDGSDQDLPQALQAFLDGGAAPIAFTPGSTNVQAARFFAAAVDACRRLGRRGILLTEFPEQLPSPLPAGLIHVPYVPLDRLLPRCSAFVHHGGIGSVSQGLKAGLPQVLMPMAHDQFDNAARLATMKVGVSLTVRRFEGEALATLLHRLTESDETREALPRIARRLESPRGLEDAARALEDRFAAG